MKKKHLLIWVVTLGITLFSTLTSVAQVEEEIKEYEGIEAQSVVFQDGMLTINWDEGEYDILYATVTTGWLENPEIIDSSIPIFYAINTSTGEEPVVIYGTAMRISTGETFNFFTRVWDPACRFIIPPTPDNGCEIYETFGGCSHTETADCNYGASASVTCEGDTNCGGSHKDESEGSTGGFATCHATSKSTYTDNAGKIIIEETTVTKTKHCPPAVENEPDNNDPDGN